MLTTAFTEAMCEKRDILACPELINYGKCSRNAVVLNYVNFLNNFRKQEMTYANYQGSQKQYPGRSEILIYLDMCGNEKRMLNKQSTQTEGAVIRIRP